jgi:putative methionine-R-sulfoxide reductase with GAF domain
MLRTAQRGASGGHIVVPMNCGQDLFDVIDIDCPQAGLDGARRRVVETMRVWVPRESRYTLTIELEAV